MAVKKEFDFPEAIYFDTNFFRGLPIHFPATKLADLADLSYRFDINLFIPKIVFNEYVKFLTEQVFKKINEFNSIKKFLEDYTNEISIPNNFFEKDEITKKIDSKVLMRFKSLGIEFIDTPKININEISDRFFIDSIYIGDEGFKDIVILETIAKHSIDKNYKKIYIVTKDKAFDNQNLLSWFTKRNIGLEIINEGKSYSNLLENLISKIDTIVKNKGFDRFTETQNRFKELLNEYRQDIYDFVIKNVKVDKKLTINRQRPLPSFYNDEDQLPIFSTILKIKDIIFKEITSVFPHEEENDNIRYHINFGVLFEFQITIRVDEYTEPKFSLNEFPEGMNYVQRDPSVEVKDITVSRNYFVKSSIDLNKAKEGKFEDFKLEEVY